MSADRLAEITERAAAASVGPWYWHGNTGNHNWSLENREWVVMAIMPVQRTENDPEIDQTVEYLADCGEDRPPDLDDPEAEAHYFAALRAKAIEMWCEYDEHTGETRADNRLFIKGGEGKHLEPLEQQVIYEVCPDANDPSDPRVYRQDFKRTRSADAEFIAHARADVDWLLTEIARLESLLAAEVTP